MPASAHDLLGLGRTALADGSIGFRSGGGCVTQHGVAGQTAQPGIHIRLAVTHEAADVDRLGQGAAVAAAVVEGLDRNSEGGGQLLRGVELFHTLVNSLRWLMPA